MTASDDLWRRAEGGAGSREARTNNRCTLGPGCTDGGAAAATGAASPLAPMTGPPGRPRGVYRFGSG